PAQSCTGVPAPPLQSSGSSLQSCTGCTGSSPSVLRRCTRLLPFSLAQVYRLLPSVWHRCTDSSPSVWHRCNQLLPWTGMASSDLTAHSPPSLISGFLHPPPS
ncbi:unnamed protein product, partial [Staurois parvus]